MKKSLLFSLILLVFGTFAFADSYQIVKTEYYCHGITRPSVLRTTVPVDYKKIFQDEDELVKYLEDFKQRLDNVRCFEKFDYDYEVSLPDENNLCFVTVFVTTYDAKHILGLPYPKFSPKGDNGYLFNFKLKFKDTNFFGSLKEMGADLNLELDTNDDPVSFKLGGTVFFDTPFNIGNVKFNWSNSHTLSYKIGSESPEWNLKTGIECEYPFDIFSVKFTFYQSFIRNLDYKNKLVSGHTIVDDSTYFVEDLKVATPIVIQDIPNWGKIYYTPSLAFKYNWDFDGIDVYNTDLIGPTITIAQEVSTSRVNYINNFRNGFDISMTQSFVYNMGLPEEKNIIPGIDIIFKAYKAFKYVGFSTYFEAFAYLNGTAKFGDKLRGIRDEQYFAVVNEQTELASTYACESPAALIFNFDLPIHICSIYWDQIPGIKKIPHISILNFELQINPFVDIALCHNAVTQSTFHYKDGFYSAGLEALVFPLKWKGFVVRASVGLDLGRKLPWFKDKLNQEWRSSSVSATEISIGLGYQY